LPTDLIVQTVMEEHPAIST